MQVARWTTLLILVIVVGIGYLAFKGWQEWSRHHLSESGWRRIPTFLGLILVSLATLLFVGYAVHNATIGGDQGGTSATMLIIKTGNTLSFFAVVVGLWGKGTARWAAVVGGCFMLFLWFWQGMSL